MSDNNGDADLQPAGPVEVSIVPSRTQGYIFLRLLTTGRSVSVHLSAQSVRALIEQMHEGLAESMLEQSDTGGSESSLCTPRHKPAPAWANMREIDRRVQVAVVQGTLVVLVRELYSEGWDEREVYGVLDRVRADLRIQDRAMEEDALMDVMDRVVGFCSPQQQLRCNRAGIE